MILYCVDAPTFLGTALIHKYAHHQNEEMVLMVDKKIYETRNLLDVLHNMKMLGVVDDIIECNMFCDTHLDLAEEEYENYCTRFYDDIFLRSGYNLCEFDEIFVLNDNWDGNVNLYFNLKKIYYVWVQCNKVFYPGRYVSGSKQYLKLLEKYDYINPFAPYAKPELRKDCLKEESNKLEKKYTIWDKEKSVNVIPLDILSNIIKCYGFNDIEDGSWLILLNSYGTLRNTINNFYYLQKKIGLRDYPYVECFSQMYNTMMDYYVPNGSMVYFKTHPNDPISDEKINTIYKNEVKNFSMAPFELLNKYLKSIHKGFKGIVGCISNSIEFFDAEIFDEVRILGSSFIKTWFFYDSIYVVLKYAMFINKRIYTTEDLKQQINNLTNIIEGNVLVNSFGYIDGDENIKNSIVVLDCLDVVENGISISKIIESLDKTNIICFLNVDLAQTFFEDRFMNCMVPIVVNKSRNNSEKLNLQRKETIWVYSEDILNRRKVYDFSFKQRHLRRGIDIIVEPVTPDYASELFEYYSLLDFKRKYLLDKNNN